MINKVRIKAWQEKGHSAINMGYRLGRPGHLGHQKLTKEYLAGPSVSVHHQEWGRHALRHHFIHRFLNFF
jgi:hypothetical protein